MKNNIHTGLLTSISPLKTLLYISFANSSKTSHTLFPVLADVSKNNKLFLREKCSPSLCSICLFFSISL